MSVHEVSYPSKNGRDTIRAWIYTPLDEPRAVVQLMHGFGEHSRRYLHMIDTLLEAGFVVAADDHIGHGKTAYDGGTLGNPGTHGTEGFRVYLEDERSLHDLAAAQFPKLPYFVFGHSWGSMLARGYAALYGGDLRGLMLCGVVSQHRGTEQMLEDEPFRRLIEAGRGEEDGMPYMAQIFGTMLARIPDAGTPNDWIACDPRIVRDHAADPFNCFHPTAQLMYDFMKLYAFIEAPDWAAKVPAGLPVYLTGGDKDPCGNYGEGIYHVANLLEETGHPTEVRVYSGYRHEVHNERATRGDVESGLCRFLNRVLA